MWYIAAKYGGLSSSMYKGFSFQLSDNRTENFLYAEAPQWP